MSRFGHGVPTVFRDVADFGHSSCQPSGRRGVPTVSVDCCFICDEGDIVSQIEADEEPGSIKVLVVGDNCSKAVFAHTVPVKGANERLRGQGHC